MGKDTVLPPGSLTLLVLFYVVHDIQSFLQTGNECAKMWSISRKGVTLHFGGLSLTKNFAVGVKWGFNLATKLSKAHVNNVVDTSRKRFILVKLKTTARCVRVLFLVNGIKRTKIIEGISRHDNKERRMPG
jgi:hypothetical protein